MRSTDGASDRVEHGDQFDPTPSLDKGGWPWWCKSTTSTRDYFERAIKLDPQNAEAMVGLAYARGRATFYGWSTAAEDKPPAQMELLTKATAINPGYALAYYVKSTVLWLAKEYPEALAAAETVVALHSSPIRPRPRCKPPEAA